MFNSSFYVSSALPPTCHPLHVQNLGTFSLCSITTTVSLFVYRFTLKVWYMLWHTIYIINYRFYEPAPLEGTMRHWGSTEPPKREPLQTNVQNICFGHWFVWRYQRSVKANYGRQAGEGWTGQSREGSGARKRRRPQRRPHQNYHTAAGRYCQWSKLAREGGPRVLRGFLSPVCPRGRKSASPQALSVGAVALH